MKLSNIQQRAITGFFFVAIMLCGVFFQISLMLITLLVFSIGSYELGRMFLIKQAINYIYSIAGSILLLFLMLSRSEFLSMNSSLLVSSTTIYMLLLVILMAITITTFKKTSNKQKMWVNIGIIYIFIGCISFFLMGLAGIKDTASMKMNPVIWVLVITWSNDVFAYLIGRKIGKHPLAPTISPKKTIEGTIGGLIFAGIAAVIFQNKDLHGPYTLHIFFIGVLIGIAATVGDLIESKAKRIANVKDSGTILPGHGGILDRFDAMLLTMPVAYCLLILFRI